MSTTSSSFDLDKAQDPVCGTMVTIRSPHRVDYADKDIYFCSVACLEAFAKNPTAYDDEGTIVVPAGSAFAFQSVKRSPGDDVAALAPAAEKPPTAAPAPRIEPALHQAAAAAQPAPPAQPRPAAVAPRRSTPPPAAPPGGGLLAKWYAWKERRYVAGGCATLLEQYRLLTATYPRMDRVERYQRLAMVHLECSQGEASQAVERAQQQHGGTDDGRAVILRNVVQYLLVTSFLAKNPAAIGMRTDVEGVVARAIAWEL